MGWVEVALVVAGWGGGEGGGGGSGGGRRCWRVAVAPVAEAIGAMGRTRRRQWVGLRRAGGVDLGWVEVGSSALWWGLGGVVARVVAA